MKPGYIREAERLPFSYPWPWALVERNSGHQIAYLIASDPEGNRFKGYIWSDASQSYTKTARPISREVIRRFWRNPPSLEAISRAKLAANKKLRAAERKAAAKGNPFGRALVRRAR
jgi:hypothetical protein